MPPSEYITQGHSLLKRRQLNPEHMLGFTADSVRQERTGVHARISIDVDRAVLAWSNFNVERDEDRLRLANSAHKQLNGLGGEYPARLLKSDLDQFCNGLWDAQLAQLMPVMMHGAAERIGPTFLLRPYILANGGTILFAPPGRGKSYMMLLMAISLDAGVSTLWPVQLSRVLFINLERSRPSVEQRVGNCNAVLGLERNRPLATINARGRSLMDVAAAAERFIGDRGIQCVMVDSISRAGAGDLNANESVNRIIDQLNRFDVAWLGLGHTPRSDESHVYGGVHFEAGADLVAQLLSEQEEGGPLGVGVQLTKKNDVGSVPMWVGALEFDELGLTGARRARPGEFQGVERAKPQSKKEMVRQHLLDAGGQSAREIEEATGIDRVTVLRLIAADPMIGRVGVDANGKGRPSVLFGVLSDRGQKVSAPGNGQKVDTSPPPELPF